VNALRTSGTSAEIIRDIFALHFPEAREVVDLTYGKGTFWKWPIDFVLIPNDKFASPDCEFREDFTATCWPCDEFHIAVFDPPFTANGPSKEGHQKRYGADRSQDGAPQNISDVHRLLRLGTLEACRIASEGVIVKTQDVIESGKYHDSEGVARDALREAGWRIIDTVRFLKGRRPQPDAARGSRIQHFRNRPSVFLIARPA